MKPIPAARQRRLIVFSVLGAVGIVLASRQVQAASFDCKKAATALEKTICADAELSKLDSRLADDYAVALNVMKDPGKLKVEQRDWLKKRDRCIPQGSRCESLSDVYRERILRVQLAMDQEGCEASEASSCALLKGDKANQELLALLDEMKSLLVHPEEELTSQKAWEQYRDEECTSQAAAVQGLPSSEEAYGECNATLTQARVNELRTYHFCGLPGCPEMKQ